MKTAQRLLLILLVSCTVSCNGMLGDMAQSITSVNEQFKLILLDQFKPLPEISLRYGERRITSGELFDMGCTLLSAQKSVTFTVTNVGIIDVPIQSIALSGRYADRFAISNINPAIVDPETGLILGPGQTLSFDVAFQASTVNDGYKAALLTIDTGKDYSPYNVTMACERIEEERAKMDIWCGNTLIPSLGTYDLGATTTTKSALFTVWNTGTGPLTVNSITISDTVNFSRTGLSNGQTIGINEKASMLINFTPGSLGDHSLVVTLNCHDNLDPLTYVVNITGYADAVPTRQIEVIDAASGVSVPDNDLYNFGDLLFYESISKTYRIKNLGTVGLNVSSIVLSDKLNFTYTGPENTTLPPEGETPITVSFNPQSGAGHLATLTITSDDDDASDRIFVLVFTGNTLYDYTVTYQGNFNTDGTAPMDSGRYQQGELFEVLDEGTLVKTDFTFAGWCDAQNGIGYYYTVASKYSMPAANLVLYAQWEPIQLSVTYNANGGTGSVPEDSNPYIKDNEVTVLGKGTMTKIGYSFAGWSRNPDGSGIIYNEGDKFTIGSADVILYARWSGYPVIVVNDTPGSYTHEFGKMGADGAYLNATIGSQRTNIDAPYVMTVENIGTSDLIINSIINSGYTDSYAISYGDFSTLPGTPVVIAPGASKMITVRFDPLELPSDYNHAADTGLARDATLNILSNDTFNSTYPIYMKGTAVTPKMTVTIDVKHIHLFNEDDDEDHGFDEYWLMHGVNPDTGQDIYIAQRYQHERRQTFAPFTRTPVYWPGLSWEPNQFSSILGDDGKYWDMYHGHWCVWKENSYRINLSIQLFDYDSGNDETYTDVTLPLVYNSVEGHFSTYFNNYMVLEGSIFNYDRTCSNDISNSSPPETWYIYANTGEQIWYFHTYDPYDRCDATIKFGITATDYTYCQYNPCTP
jgi:uncharacterized repeat protein (TIGR02543 family)